MALYVHQWGGHDVDVSLPIGIVVAVGIANLIWGYWYIPVSILMALLGYAMGNYLAPLTGQLARMAAGQ